MHAPRFVTSLAIGTLSVLSLSEAAVAATAYAGDKISIFAEPRNRANEILGLLHAGEIVTIDRCTESGLWCRVFHNGPTGWVPASYLVGGAAKIEATPPRSLTRSAFDDHGHTNHGNIF